MAGTAKAESEAKPTPGLLLILTSSPSGPTSPSLLIQDLFHLNPTQRINYIPITTDPNTTNPYTNLTLYNISIPPPNLLSNPLPHINTPTSTSKTPNPNPIETRLYTLLTTTTTSPNSPTNNNPFTKPSPPILHLVSLTPAPTLPTSELHTWYEEEHIPLFKHIPGWIRSRRGELISFSSSSFASDLASSSVEEPPNGEERPPIWIAIHEWESMKSFETEEYEKAIGTEWRNSVIGRVDKRERMLWRVSDGDSNSNDGKEE